MNGTPRVVAVGSHVEHDGELHSVAALTARHIVLRHAVTGTETVVSASKLASLRPVGDPEPVPAGEWLDHTAFATGAVDAAERRVGHLREVDTGYRSGTAGRALPHEPRPEYDPARTTITQRVETKAAELAGTDLAMSRATSSSSAAGSPTAACGPSPTGAARPAPARRAVPVPRRCRSCGRSSRRSRGAAPATGSG